VDSITAPWQNLNSMAVYGFVRVTEELDEIASGRDAARDCARTHGLGELLFPEAPATPIEADPALWKPVRLAWLVQEKLQPGDDLVVPDMSRVARSMQEISQFLSVCAARRIVLHVAKEDLTVRPDAAGAGLTRENAALFAEFERQIVVAAMKDAYKNRAAGKDAGKTGRPRRN
jgi:hypothetical protein